MKILHIIAQLPAKTGSGVYFSNLIREFKKHGENYGIFGYDEEIDYTFEELPENHTYPVIFGKEPLNFNIVGMSDTMPYKSTRYKDMSRDMIEDWKRAFTKQIMLAYEEIKPDIVICHHLWMLSSLVLDLLRDKVEKIVGICHGTDLRQGAQNPKLKENYVRDLNRFDMIFALSDRQIEEISKEYNIPLEKIHYTGGGYNQEFFYRDNIYKYDIHNNFINLVYAGKISDSKGVYELIDAFKSLNYGTDIILNIIGTPQGEDIKRIGEKISDSKNIKLFNAKNQESLANLFRYSDVFILPSYYEGLGLVAIEALASGCFIVSSDLKPLKEVLGDNVNKSNAIKYCPLPNLVNVDTPVLEEVPNYVKNLASAIDIQVQRVKAEEKIPEDVYESIRVHSWENIAEKMYKIIVEN
ncbi:glycosyltransferase family 4 protein [Lagierella sp.]|uniref:glycosyltransferase family 4 protein n=1 Tax=Lagierella sp. TaxID=2849657 RepID=UPI00261E4C87|nr:glycosyltransferase family 4 protein [Lagierella sp.]